ncbi:GtrA family protein [Paenibacillus sp.]|jgi:putative flippase GtrA|uniref:GtrA family protein n=1 Tax=Paenibacillus sp. TaxID=58172 RepID=UPI002832F152|nr:GtrA family protein [Paenibacillus sp.]MDR0267995.1 GtrA family protein [Paenibacillus sp.]
MKSFVTSDSFRSFIIFGLVGILNTGVDVAVFTLLTWWQLPWLAAQVAAYSCGVLNSFLMNRKWTFKQQGAFVKGLLRFVLLNMLTLGVTSACMLLLQEQFGISLWLSKGAATVLGVLLNFAGSRWWVFRAEPHVSRETESSHMSTGV